MPRTDSRPPATRQRLLEAALEVFARDGFRGATIERICRKAGANIAAAHYHFGDKRRLFRQALNHYLGRLRDKMARLEASRSPAEAITGFFEDTVERSLGDKLQRGCMLVNSALEASPRDVEQ